MEYSSNYEAAKKFNVDRKSTKGKLECGSRNRTRLDGARSEPFDPLLQNSHLNGSTNDESNGLHVWRNMTRGKTLYIHGKEWVGKEVQDQKWKVGQVIGGCDLFGLWLEGKILVLS